MLTYKYRIKDRRAKRMLRAHAYAVNQVWNYCCAHQLDIEARYRAGEKPRQWASHFTLQKLCKGVSAELGLHAQSIGGVCKQFAQSRNKAGRAPRFRSSFGSRRALGWIPFEQQTRQTKGNTVTYLGKCYRFWEGGRPLPVSAKGGAFVEDSLGRWYVCFHIDIDREHGEGAAVGIDLGLKSFAALSDGRKIESPQVYRRHEVRVAIADRAGNMRRVRQLHAKIKNCRRDFLHKATTELAREYALIAVGNVNSKQLARTRMAKSVLDAGWSLFRLMLKYKSASYVEVDEQFTSQTCSQCGSLPRERPKGIAGLGIRKWECSECGASHDRDVNAARNILAIALSAQRPAEGSQKVDKHEGHAELSRPQTVLQ
jgi:putative transposase